MQIDETVKLAHIELTDGEKKLFSKQLGDIVEYINKLNELNTSNIAPTAHVLPLKNVFREDILKPSLPKNKALQNAPDRSGNFYKVPKIIE